MSFSDKQARALKSKLSHQHVKTRSSNGNTIAYVEGWHVIAEANRIFGYENWDRSTLQPKCLWTELQLGQTVCFYSTRVRITVRAGEIVVVREGIGTGVGRAPSAETAHELALKAAETDATKRALATFGNPFGLALYDKEQNGVTKPPVRASKARSHNSRTYELIDPGKGAARALDAKAFSVAALAIIAEISTIDDVYAFWESNKQSLSAIRNATDTQGGDPVQGIIVALKERARSLGAKPKVEDRPGIIERSPSIPRTAMVRVHPVAGLPMQKERRVRDKDHLRFVAGQPCLVCGRRPAHAHHLRYAQLTAMAMKVSDEFTVPLCAIHHDSLHRTSDERAWWARNGIIDPLKIAERLWNTPKQERLRWLQIDETDQREESPSATKEHRTVEQTEMPADRPQHANGSGANSSSTSPIESTQGRS